MTQPAARVDLSGIVSGAARDARLASTTRADIGKLLASKEVRKVADADPQLLATITAVTGALTEAEKASAAWQKALAEAAKKWQASLAELAKTHPDG